MEDWERDIEKGRERAFDAVYRQTGDPDLADDSSAEAVVSTARRAPFLPGDCDLVAYMVVVALRASWRELKLRKTRRTVPLDGIDDRVPAKDDDARDPAEVAELLESLSILDDAMRRLGREDLLLIRDRYFVGSTLADIGRARGWTTNVAASRTYRALRRLKAEYLRIAGEI